MMQIYNAFLFCKNKSPEKFFNAIRMFGMKKPDFICQAVWLTVLPVLYQKNMLLGRHIRDCEGSK
jgi:hypothetical protein